MNPTNGIVLTALMVFLGRWAQGKPVAPSVIVGMSGATLGLAVINQSSPKVAGRLALCLVLTAAFMYGPDLAKALKNLGTPSDARSHSSFGGGSGGTSGNGGGGGGSGSW